MRALIFVCFFLFSLAGLTQELRFSTYSLEDGLAQSQVYSMLEDQRGVLWLGTRGGGVSAFDGQEFENFGERNGLVNNFVKCIKETPTGILLIGTDKGLSIYDGIQFSNHLQKSSDFKREIMDILPLEGSLLALATNYGLEFFDPTKSSSPLRTIVPKKGYTKQYIDCLFLDRDSILWMGSRMGLFYAKLNELQKKGNGISEVKELSNQRITSIIKSQTGELIATTYSGKVFWLSSTRSKNNLTVTKEEKFGEDNVVFSSFIDKKNDLWICTLKKGVCKINKDGISCFSEKEGLPTTHARTFLEDRWGNLWVGTSGGGLSKFSGNQFEHYGQNSGLPGRRVYSFAADSLNNIWMSTSQGGVVKFSDEGFSHFGVDQGLKQEISKCILFDKNGRLWVGYEGEGLSVMDSSGITQLKKADGLSHDWIKSLMLDNENNIWVGTAGNGITIIPSATIDSSKTYSFLKKKNGLAGNRVLQTKLDKYGGVWIATQGNGLSYFIGGKISNISEENQLCNNSVRSITLDVRGTLWAGTAKGVTRIKYNPQDELADWDIQCIDVNEGLISNNIYLGIPDSNGDLWVGSERGVDKLNLNEEGNLVNISHFGLNEGFKGIETCQRASLLDSEGNLWFGTINGIVKRKPVEYKKTISPPLIHFTAIESSYKPIYGLHTDKDEDKWKRIPSEITLPFSDNHLSFDFKAIHQSEAHKLTYQWKMEGLDKAWSPLSKKTSVGFAHLPPGNYTFLISACIDENNCSPEPKKIHVCITPPIWKIWWFRLLVFGLLFLTIFVIARWRIKEFHRTNEEKRKQLEVSKTIIELEQKALRLQMNPHFIFNALNSIKGCMAQKDLKTARENIVKFARLMRLILDNSREGLIPLEKEIMSLRLYLELEQLSSSHGFKYEISLPEIEDGSELMIPPMLIQPFVENSVIHGIGPLNGDGKIEITFSEHDSFLNCKIQDNGIGRKASSKKKELGTSLHKSAGVEVTRKRIEMLKPKSGTSGSIHFIDLPEGSGTIVEIKIPLPTKKA